VTKKNDELGKLAEEIEGDRQAKAAVATAKPGDMTPAERRVRGAENDLKSASFRYMNEKRALAARHVEFEAAEAALAEAKERLDERRKELEEEQAEATADSE